MTSENHQPETSGPKKNRKQRRFDAAIERGKYPRKGRKYYSVTHWVLRLAGEMKENKQVQELILSGKLDKYLG